MAAREKIKNDKFRKVDANKEIYSDFLHLFLPHPNTGQITRKTNADAVKLSIRNILLTDKYERLRNPKIGSNLRHYLFEMFGESTRKEVETEIRSVLSNYEPRARILNIHVTDLIDKNAMSVQIEFSLVTSLTKESVELTLYRAR